MNRRLILSAFLVLCLSTGLLAQGKLGVYAAAFYNLENLWDTEDNPDNPGDDDFTPVSYTHLTLPTILLV